MELQRTFYYSGISPLLDGEAAKIAEEAHKIDESAQITLVSMNPAETTAQILVRRVDEHGRTFTMTRHLKRLGTTSAYEDANGGVFIRPLA